MVAVAIHSNALRLAGKLERTTTTANSGILRPVEDLQCHSSICRPGERTDWQDPTADYDGGSFLCPAHRIVADYERDEGEEKCRQLDRTCNATFPRGSAQVFGHPRNPERMAYSWIGTVFTYMGPIMP